MEIQPLGASIEHRSPSVFACPTAGQLADDPLNWYAAYTRSHHEKSVARHLAHKGIECFVPLYRTRHAWSNNRSAELQLPLFPNYVFVRIRRQFLWSTLDTPGIYSVISRGSDPEPLPFEVIRQLQAGVEANSLQPCTGTPLGTHVRITAGPFSGVSGILVRKKRGLRVILSVDVILKSVAVEVDAREIVPLKKA
jgi:transcription antitermination factor NusG